MKLPIIFMFSGQGSQYFHMGEKLFNENNIFKKWMQKTNQLCQEITGLSLLDSLYSSPKTKADPFSQIELSHPAIFMVEYALTQTLIENNIKPDFVLGASMGEFAAATTAGIMSFESALHAVIKQAEAIKTCPGSMLAILDTPDLYYKHAYLNQYSELAAVNFSSHFVVSGNIDNLNMIIQKLNEHRIISQLLSAASGFHSSLIDSAKKNFLESIQSLTLHHPSIPFVSCMEAKTLESVTHTHFWDVVRFPILFQKTIQYLEEQQPGMYIDVGPSGTLATFTKYNFSQSTQSKFLSILSPMGDDVKSFNNALFTMNT